MTSAAAVAYLLQGWMYNGFSDTLPHNVIELLFEGLLLFCPAVH